MNLADVFFETAARQPDQPAIIGPRPGDCLSYDELRQQVEATSEKLKAAGVQPGSCVGLHYLSGREYVILTYALWKCGACVVPMAVELTADEKHQILRDISVTTAISKSDAVSLIEPFRAGSAVSVWDDVIAAPVRSRREAPPEFAAANAAFLRFTSGTTGTSKGVVLSHDSIYDRIHLANDGLRIGPADRVVWLLSMSYHFAVSIVSYLTFGATILLCRNHLGGTIVETAQRHEATVIYGSPVHYDLMTQDRGPGIMSSLRLAISTATSLKMGIAQAFRKRFDKPLSQAYGIIEVGLPCINFDDPLGRPGSVGRVLPGYEIKLEDIGLGPDLQSIRLRGKGFLDAYYDPWRLRPQILQDGWFATGDLGRLDQDGYLHILGRSKEMINVAGMKFFPVEVEAVLESHPIISEARVFSLPSDRLGEAPHAEVVLAEDASYQPSLKELRDYCRERIALFKIPETIEFVDRLARNASGKLLRTERTARKPRTEVAHAN